MKSVVSGVRMRTEVKEKYFKLLEEKGTYFTKRINEFIKFELENYFINFEKLPKPPVLEEKEK